MTAYTLTPLGAAGVDEERVEVVHGPTLPDSLTRAELARRLVAQAEELAAVRKQLVVAQAAAGHMGRMRERMDNESVLRTRVQQRLSRVALALATIAHRCPEAGEQVVAAREEIWGSDVR
jgi:hypothetical protein